MSTHSLLSNEDGEVPSVYPQLKETSSSYGAIEENVRKRSKSLTAITAVAIPPASSSAPDTAQVESLYPSLEDKAVAINQASPDASPSSKDTPKEGEGSLLAVANHVWDNKTLYGLSVLVGVIFGFALERGKVDEYYFVRNQMSMTNTFVMLKMFLSANIVSTVSITLLSYFGSESVRQNVKATGDWMGVYHRGFPALIIGCALLGVGLTVSGSCPGTVFAQIGAGSSKAGYSVLGGILGAVVYGLLDANTAFQNFHTLGKLDTKYNFLYGPRFPRWLTTLIVVTMFGTVCALAEYFVPWRTDFLKLFPASQVSWSYMFHPFLAGAIIGSLQLLLVGVIQQHLGCSGSYCTVVANAMFFYKSSPHFNILKTRYWQVLMVLGMCLGAFISTSASGVYFASDNMLKWWESFLGGFIFVFGSRMAAGCTSGHGISGCGHLAFTSFVGVGAMFGGSIATYYIAYN